MTGWRAPCRAVLWDLDGVLIDSSPVHQASYEKVYERYGLAAVPYPTIAGRTTREVLAGMGLGGPLLDEAVRAKQEAARRELAAADVLHEGALAALADCRDLGLASAIVTGSSAATVEMIRRRFGFDRFLDEIVAAEDAAPGKPHPDPYLEGCRRLDVLPVEALVVEDAAPGIRSALAAGTRVCQVHTGDVGVEPHLRAGDLTAVRRILAARSCQADPRGALRFARHVEPVPAPSSCVAVVPAAGRGSRLGLDRPKVLLSIAGASILEHIHSQLCEVAAEIVVVVSPEGRDEVARHARQRSLNVHLVVQEEPSGMAGAVLCAGRVATAARSARLLIVWGDQVTLRAATLRRLVAVHRQTGAEVSLPTRVVEEPYIHLVRSERGLLTGVLQRREGDPMPGRGENDCGVFLVENRDFFARLARHLAEPGQRGRVTGEVNFLPFLTGGSFAGTCCLRGVDERETLGVNTPEEAERAARLLGGQV